MKGLSAHRQKDNPLEKRFAEQWEEINERGHVLEYLLSGPENKRVDATPEQQELAATIIQWLGSPVGQFFLVEVLDIDIRKQVAEKLGLE